MKKILLAGVAAASFAVSASSALAAYVGSTSAANNEVIGTSEGWYNANLYLVGGPADIEFTFFGYEAGDTNTFEYGDGSVVSFTGGGGTAFPGTQVVVNNIASGLIDFIFSNPNNGSVANGSNSDISLGLVNFYVTFGDPYDTNVDGSTASGGQIAWLAFDDLGAGPDDNHDDLVVRLKIVNGGTFTVPEPAALALFGLGLAGLGFARRRKAA